MKHKYMKIAMEEAIIAYDEGEIPVGAVIVKNNEIIVQAHNMKEQLNCSTKHAEIIAIEEASRKLNTWRLNDCDIYLTMEPCLMCCGALIQSRINKIYYLVKNDKFGALISIEQVLNDIKSNHKIKYEKINDLELEKENIKLLKDFFEVKR